MRRLASLTFVGVLVLASTASAQDEKGPNFQAVSAAKALFEQGQKQLEEKNYDSACASFKASNEAVARVGTLLNLADCYEKGGKLASAWGAYFDAISLGRRQGKPEYEEFATKKRDELEPKLLKMTIVVPPDVKVEGMKITRDKVVVEPAAWGLPMAVDAGKHSIDVTAPHKLPFHVDASADEEHRVAVVTIEKLTEAPMAWARTNGPQIIERVVEVPSVWTGMRVGGIIAGSAGIVAVALGSVLGLVANDKYQSALKNDCNGDPMMCSAAGASNGGNAHDLANVATGLFIGGLVAVAGGITLFVIGAPSRPSAEAGATARIRIAPLTGGGAASIVGTF